MGKSLSFSKSWTLTLLVIILCICLTGCDAQKSCIEADDFGAPTITVSSRYSKAELGQQYGMDQIAPWRDSGYRVNGRPLTILVHGWRQGVDANKPSEASAWCAWYGQSSDGNKLSTFCERLQECQFTEDLMCTPTRDAQITNAPCIFLKGVGMYALIAAPGSDPNLSLASQRSPSGLTFHLGEPTNDYQMLDIDKNGNTRQAGGLVYQYQNSDSVRNQYEGAQLYFKILDRFYDDNSGALKVTIKSGITDLDADPITFVTNLVKNFLFGTSGDYGLIRNIYLGIVNNPGYRMAVSGLLTIFVIWTTLSYLTGNINITQTELIIRVLKIALVSTLLNSEYSWKFFNDYLFVWFVGGVQQVLAMVQEAGATGPGSVSIIGLMMAPETMVKLFSLLFIDWRGFIYILLFFGALYFMLTVYFFASILYLTALIAIGLIITMAPIFICFMLFGITKSLYENWLRQLISYAIQPVILFTGLVFISMILRNEIYGALGFKVCKHTFPKMDYGGAAVISNFTRDQLGLDLGDSLFYWWFPEPMKGENFTRTTVNIPIPIDHVVSSDNNTSIIAGSNASSGEFCEAYGCVGPRYVDLPFLDPAKDSRRINQFWNGNFVQFDGLLLIFVAIYLLHKFNSITVSIARFITGTSGNQTNISQVASHATAGIEKKIIQGKDYVQGKLARTKAGRAIGKVYDKAVELKDKAKQLPSMAVDKARIFLLRKEALSPTLRNKAVEEETKRLSGLDASDINPNAIKEYRQLLKERMMQQGFSEEEATKIAKEMSKLGFDNLKNGLAQKLYGSEYDDLTQTQQNRIKAIMNAGDNGKSLKEAATEANAARRYQEAYIDAYQSLSERGIGITGKHNRTIRSLQELNYRAEEVQRKKKEEQRQKGEELYAGYESLKHGLYARVTGGREDGFGHTFAGGAWHEIDTNKAAKNYRMRTYNEVIEDSRRELAYREIEKEIADLSKKYGESVIAPEFIAKAKAARLEGVERFELLQAEHAKNLVYQELTADKDGDGKNPILKGNTYMSKYATDSKLREMIDRTNQAKKDLFEKDVFTNREEYHRNKVELAAGEMLEQERKLKRHFKKTNITESELLYLLDRYHKETNELSHIATAEITKLQQAFQDFHVSQQVLQEIDRRKIEIAAEVDRHIGVINEHRIKGGMQEYAPPTEMFEVRRLKSIDDYRKEQEQAARAQGHERRDIPPQPRELEAAPQPPREAPQEPPAPRGGQQAAQQQGPQEQQQGAQVQPQEERRAEAGQRQGQEPPAVQHQVPQEEAAIRPAAPQSAREEAAAPVQQPVQEAQIIQQNREVIQQHLELPNLQATDVQINRLFERADQLKEQSIQDYEVGHNRAVYEKAAKDATAEIAEQRMNVEKILGYSDFPDNEMPARLEQFIKDNPAAASNEAMPKPEDINRSLEKYENAQFVVNEIDQRKEELVKEIDHEVGRHVEAINEYRKQASRSEYQPPEAHRARLKRTIEQLKRPNQ